jgi:hypothetical protein
MFYGDFENEEDVFQNFSVSDADREGVGIFFAVYDTPPYEGYALVIFVRNGKFYVVEGSHCSCYGLEGQWTPDEVDLRVLFHMAQNAEGGLFNDYSGEILKALERLEHLDVASMTPQDVQLYVRLAAC